MCTVDLCVWSISKLAGCLSKLCGGEESSAAQRRGEERRGTGHTPVIFSINFLTSVHKEPYSSAFRSPHTSWPASAPKSSSSLAVWTPLLTYLFCLYLAFSGKESRRLCIQIMYVVPKRNCTESRNFTFASRLRSTTLLWCLQCSHSEANNLRKTVQPHFSARLSRERL